MPAIGLTRASRRTNRRVATPSNRCQVDRLKKTRCIAAAPAFGPAKAPTLVTALTQDAGSAACACPWRGRILTPLDRTDAGVSLY